jgi:hypothetical protein
VCDDPGTAPVVAAYRQGRGREGPKMSRSALGATSITEMMAPSLLGLYNSRAPGAVSGFIYILSDTELETWRLVGWHVDRLWH